MHTISTVDIATGWWEPEPILRRTQENTRDGMDRIGKLDIGRGCYTGYEVFRLAAADLARRGLTGRVSALLRAGRHTVREFLTARYSVAMGQREQWHDSRWTPDQADLKDFLGREQRCGTLYVFATLLLDAVRYFHMAKSVPLKESATIADENKRRKYRAAEGA